MQTDYTPPPANIAKALGLLGCDWEGSTTETDYPKLIGMLLAKAEVTAANLLREEDEAAVLKAYADVFLTYARGPHSNSTEKAEGWEDFLIALTQGADRLYHLHEVTPPLAFGKTDKAVASAAGRAAGIAMFLANLRLGLSLDERGMYVGDDLNGSELPKLVVGTRELDDLLSGIATDLDVSETPYFRHVVKDLGDDYDVIMAEFLDQMVAGRYLTGWEHQPENGSGNGSIVLLHPKYGGGYVMNYDDALEYARGFVDCMEQTSLNGIEEATEKTEG